MCVFVEPAVAAGICCDCTGACEFGAFHFFYPCVFLDDHLESKIFLFKTKRILHEARGWLPQLHLTLLNCSAGSNAA